MSQLSTSQINTFINAHDTYRANVNPPAANPIQQLVWSPDLATEASNWASQCAFAHSGTPGVGENIYVTSARTPNVTNFDPNSAISSWGAEKQYYNYNTNSCEGNNVCGHYTQMVWANSKNLGCGVQDCPNLKNVPPSWPNGGTLVVCQYTPQGNWVGQRPY